AVRRLRQAGAVGLGKLNMTELALGPFGDNPHHGDAQNPWRTGCAAGGSLSGGGVAGAAGLVLGAVGSDTGGSIRLPAACCGIVGLKPTYGRVSRAGAMPLSWSLDHLGPMARTVADTALMLGAMAGHDPADATSSRRAVPDYAGALARARLTREFGREVFAEVDVLLTPVIPEPAPALDQVTAGAPGEVVLRMARFARLTRPLNGLGLPALSVPCGFTASGLPQALQTVGRPF